MWHVLEHVPNLVERINEIKRILKEDGLLVIAVPNSNSYDAKHYDKFWAAYDVPRHLYHFNIDTINKLADENGLFVIDIKPMKFDSFYVSLLSEKYKNKSKNIFKAFYYGLLSNCKAKKNNDYSSLIFLVKIKKSN